MQRNWTFAVLALSVAMAGWHRPAGAAVIYPGDGHAGPFAAFSISPSSPTELDVVRFKDPYDRQMFAGPAKFVRTHGLPSLAFDFDQRTIDLVLTPRNQSVDPIMPTTGLEGDFGRLAPGVWTYRSLETHTFTVRAVPEPASLLIAATISTLLLLRRR